MPNGFELDPRLASSTLALGDLMLCRLRLVDDSRFPWIMLVPRRQGLREFTDLSTTERTIVMEEIATVSRALQEVCAAEKLNVGALGNMVPQLHVHVVARFEADAAWPGPVWGNGKPVRYEPASAEAMLAQCKAKLGIK